MSQKNINLKETLTDKLRSLLNNKEFIPIPSCFDALSAKLIQQANFDVTFMSGFAASASRIGSPDLGPYDFLRGF
jgi:2-methylisocitrate lyase-like PEP mutase family enzyme